MSAIANLADLTIGIGVDDNLSGGLNSASNKVETFGDKVSRQSQKLVDLGGGMQSAGRKMSLFATLPIAGGFAKATGAAEDLNESVNAVNVVFGDASEGVLKLSDAAAETVGLSKSEFNGLAVQFSSFADTLAGESGDVAGVLGDMTGRASDFASVMNMDVNEAARLFQSGLAGETEPLKKYGINLSAAAVEAHALEKGITDDTAAMTEAEKVQARYSLLMEETAKTQGDFANTSDQSANAQRIAAARASDLAAEFGQNLIPVKVKALEIAGSLLDRFNAMSPTMKTAAVVVGGVVAAAGPLIFILGTLVRSVGALGQAFTVAGPKIAAVAKSTAAGAKSAILALGRWIAATASWVAQQVAAGAKALASMAATAGRFIAHYARMAAASMANAARMAASWVIAMGPVGWVIAAVVALVALIIANWDKVKEWTAKIWNWVGDKVEAVWKWMQDATKKAVAAVVGFVQNLRDRATQIVQNIVDFVRKYHPIMILWRLAKEWVPKAIALFINLKDRAVALVTGLKDRAVSIVTGLRDRAIAIVTTMRDNLVGNFRRLKDMIVGAAITLRDRAASIFTGLKDRVVDTITSLMDRVRGIKDTVVGFFSGAADWLVGAGNSLIMGLWDGIKAMGGWLSRQVGDFVHRNTVGKIQSVLGISSPSKVMMEVGEDTMRGMTLGMGSEVDALSKMAERTASAALPDLGTPGVPRVGAVGGDGARAAGSDSRPINLTLDLGEGITQRFRIEQDGQARQIRSTSRAR